MTEETFKLPRSSYEELVKIIEAYGSRGKEATIDEIATVVAINRTIVSGNNGFLVTMGIIEGGNKKIITEEGKELSRALGHNVPDEIARLWRSFLLSNEFLQKILSAVRIRKGMDVSTLQAHIAYSAGQPKNPLTTTGAMTVINIFKAAGLMIEENGKLLTVEQPMVTPESGEVSIPKPDTKSDSNIQLITQKQSYPVAQISGQQEGISFSVNIQIQCAVDEIETLGPKIKKLIKDISEPSKEHQLEISE